jgi:hypothetical protein
MRKIFALLIILSFGFSPQVQALPEVQRFVDVDYITGGISIEEEQAIAEIAKDFTLKIISALKCGDYLNNINILILNQEGHIVLEAVTDGPILYANLPDGSYKVTASAGGESFTQPVKTRSGRQSQLIFSWPVEPKSCLPE